MYVRVVDIKTVNGVLNARWKIITNLMISQLSGMQKYC